MEQDKLEIEKQLLQIHYYFTDESHSMDAFVRNAMEKYLLNLMKEIANILDVNINIDSEAKKQGSLIDTISVSQVVVGCIGSIIVPITIYYLTGGFKKNKGMDLDNALKAQKLEMDKILTEKERIKLHQLYKKLTINHKSNRIVSNFYNKAEKYEKIEKIGYKTANQSEIVVERNKFKTFILTENKDIELIENAEIEIISPVLKEDEYKWKGIYNGNKIDFSMGDSSFKNDVITQKYNFINGTSIICDLEISRTFDEYGEEVKISYRVKKVVGTRLDEKIELTKFGLKRKRQKEKDLQPNLFNYQERSNND